MTKALVISGGGARGAFEAGVCCKLLPHDFDAVYGTSSGAINAVLFSYLEPSEIAQEWSTGLDDAYALDILSGKGIFNSNPIAAKVAKILTTKQAKIPVTVAVTDLSTGKAVYARNTVDSGSFAAAVAESATIPGLCYSTTDANRADGGMTNDLPVGQALADGHDELTIILVNPYGPADTDAPNTVTDPLTALSLALQAMLQAGIWNSIDMNLPRMKSLTVYAPKTDAELGEYLAFDPRTLTANFGLGMLCKPLIVK